MSGAQAKLFLANMKQCKLNSFPSCLFKRLQGEEGEYLLLAFLTHTAMILKARPPHPCSAPVHSRGGGGRRKKVGHLTIQYECWERQFFSWDSGEASRLMQLSPPPSLLIGVLINP